MNLEEAVAITSVQAQGGRGFAIVEVGPADGNPKSHDHVLAMGALGGRTYNQHTRKVGGVS